MMSKEGSICAQRIGKWKKYYLKEIAEVQTGPFGSQLHQKDYVIDGVPIITVEHLGENRLLHENLPRVSEEDRTRLSKYVLREGDIVFSRVGSVDRRAYVNNDEDGWLFSGRCLRVRPISDELDSKYLSYYFGLNSFKEYIRAIAVGSTMPSLNTTILSDIEIPLPPFPTQRRIAAILSALDEKIELNRQTNATLEAIAQAIFKEWFVDFNFPGTLVGAGSKPALKRSIPEGWHVGTLTDMIELNPKTSLKKGTIAKYVEMKDLSTGSAAINSFIEREFSSGSKFQQGDTLLARITPCLENGKTGFVDFLEKDEAGWGSTEFIVMRGKGVVSPYFVYCLARQESFREFAIQSMVGSSGRQRVVESILADFPIVIPDELTMAKYHSIAEPIFRKIKGCAYQSGILVQIRDNLLPKLMNGGIDVRERTGLEPRAGLEPAPTAATVLMTYEPILTVNIYGHNEQ